MIKNLRADLKLRQTASLAALTVAAFACPLATAFASPISIDLRASGDWGTSGNQGAGPVTVTPNLSVSALTGVNHDVKLKVASLAGFTGISGTVYVDPSNLVKTKQNTFIQTGDRGTGVQAAYAVKIKDQKLIGPGSLDGSGSAADAREALVLMFSGNAGTPDLLPLADSLKIDLNGYDCGATCSNYIKAGTPYTAYGVSILLDFTDGTQQIFSESQIEATFPHINNFDQPVIDLAALGVGGGKQVSQAIVRADLGSFWVSGVQFDLATGPAPDSVPEPGGGALFGLGLAALGVYRRRRWQSRARSRPD